VTSVCRAVVPFSCHPSCCISVNFYSSLSLISPVIFVLSHNQVLEEFTASNAIVLLRLKTTSSLARAEQIEEVYKAFARHFQSVADLFFREQASARARNTTRTTRRRQAGFLRSLEAMATTESKERDERRGAVWNLVARLESVVHSLQRELSAARRPSSSIGV